MSEDQLVAWLRQQPGASLIGDDVAVLPGNERWIVTVDQQIEGIHVPPWLPLDQRGRRLVAVNLSDLAAAGARPVWGFLALAAPPDWDHRSFFGGVLEVLAREGAVLAGGDLARSPTPAGSLTLLGRTPRDQVPPGRSGASAGDELWIGGPLGLSALGQHLLAAGARPGKPETVPEGARAWLSLAAEAITVHLLPRPQLELGRWLLGRATASMDVSDGLTLDVSRLCRESDVGAILDEEVLAPSETFRKASEALDLDPWQLILGGGEDYVLLFSLPPESQRPVLPGCLRIGQLRSQRGLSMRASDGRERPLARAGWDHLSLA